MTLLMLVLLQAVLGFDNLLYISIESKRVNEANQPFVRRLGIGLAIVLRIVLLLIIIKAINVFQYPLFSFDWRLIQGQVNGHSLIVLGGGTFILYTAVKEISHMLVIDDLESHNTEARHTVGAAVFWIVIMNLIFSFDSILSAMALAVKNDDGAYPLSSIIIMATAIVISGGLMVLLADTVSEFLKKNKMYEVLGLFVLFIVGVLLVSEGGHLAHIKLLDYEVHPMAKSTFYFVLVILVLVDVVQSRYQKKLMAQT